MSMTIKQAPGYVSGQLIKIRGTGGGFKVSTSTPSAPTIVQSGLILHLDAGDPSSYPGFGNSWTDLSGHGHEAVVIGTSYSSADGGSIDFGSETSPTTKYGIVSMSSNLRPTTGLTEAVWVKQPAFSAGLRVYIAVQKGTGTENSYALFTGGSNELYGDVHTGTEIYDWRGTTTLNTWQYLVHTYDGSSQELYINGLSVGWFSTSGNIQYDMSNTLLTLGMNYDGPGYDTGISGHGIGNMSIVQIYNRALSSLEIVQNFNVTCARYGLSPIVP